MVEFDPASHTYSTEDGKVLISVTQLLHKHGLSPSFEGIPEAVLERAADRGTEIHAEFEAVVKNNGNAVVLSDEAQWFADSIFSKTEGTWESEQMIWTEGEPVDYAGTIDLIHHRPDGSVALMDIKTGKVYSDSVAWQLSLYRYAYAQRNHLKAEDIELYCIDAKPEKCFIHPVVPVRTEEITRLLRFEADDVPYTPGDIMLNPQNLARVEQFESAIASLDAQKKKIQEEYDSFQNQLMDAMLNNGIKTFETPKFKVTFVASTVQTSFDSAKFKKDHADLYKEYQTKVTPKKAYLKVTEKKNEV